MVEGQVWTKVVGNSGTVGDGELEGMLRDCVLNDLFNFHRSKERKEILMEYKSPVCKPFTLC